MFVTPWALRWSISIANVYSLPKEKEKEKRNSLKSLRTFYFQLYYSKLTGDFFLSQDKIRRNFPFSMIE